MFWYLLLYFENMFSFVFLWVDINLYFIYGVIEMVIEKKNLKMINFEFRLKEMYLLRIVIVCVKVFWENILL